MLFLSLRDAKKIAPLGMNNTHHSNWMCHGTALETCDCCDNAYTII